MVSTIANISQGSAKFCDECLLPLAIKMDEAVMAKEENWIANEL